MTEQRSPLIARLWLTGVVFGQILLTPMAAFSITYLFEFEKTSAGFSINFQQSMIPWIISASLAYGMIALCLALLVGGFTPKFVIQQGGWLRTIGLVRGRRQADAVAKSKMRVYNSPQGRMTRMVSERLESGYGLLSIHGGLVLLAIPFQLILVVLPLATMLFIPDEWMATHRMLEFSLVSYIIILIFVMQIFPTFSKRFVTIAAFTRRWLISMTKLSWLAPILVLWLLGRLASVIVVTWIGPDIGASIAVEKQVFEDWLNIGSVPDNSFLDLLTALAVMPMSAFTTLVVLGGGSGPLPDWMRLGKGEGWQSPEGEELGEEEVEELDFAAEEDREATLTEKALGTATGVVTGAGILAGGALMTSQSLRESSSEVTATAQADSSPDIEPSAGAGTGTGGGEEGQDMASDMMMSMFERFD